MTGLPLARAVLTDRPARCDGRVVLGYDARLLRRKRLETENGLAFLADLPQVTNLDDYWGFLLSDGRAIEVVPADEALVDVTGPDLLRYAWHIGNRHTPCEIRAGSLRIRADHVLEAMLSGLGATLAAITGPFRPEGGAYGTGRTMGHSHGAEDGARFGWHDHGDGRPHVHPPAERQPFGHKDAT
jgi:urease accessory protein